MRKAQFAESLAHGVVACRACPRECILADGQTGLCRVRHNVGGELFSSSFGRPVAMCVEPVEKKFLFHAFPGTRTLSLGAAGCNMTCGYCINGAVAQRAVDSADLEVAPEAVVRDALMHGVRCIAFTYTEPTTFIEYALEIADLARRAGLAIVAKSNGFMSAAVLTRLAGAIDAINIDLKAWQADRHAKLTGVPLAPILENLELARRLGVWLEVTTPVIPGVNDSTADLDAIARFVASALGRETPWHVQRFYPDFRMHATPATSLDQLTRAAAAGAAAGLEYVYCKDLDGGRQWDTRCPRCGDVAIARQRDLTNIDNRLTDGACSRCRQTIPGIGMRTSTHEQDEASSWPTITRPIAMSATSRT